MRHHFITQKLNVSIIQYTKLNVGTGTEKAVLNFSRYYPRDKFNLTIYQTDKGSQQNLTEDEVQSYLNGTELITLSSIDARFRLSEIINSEESGKFERAFARLFSTFLTVTVRPLLNVVINKNKLRKIYDSHIIYIYDAENAGFVPFNLTHSLIIGCMRGTYEDVLQGGKHSKLTKRTVQLLYAIIMRKITVFHFLTKKLMDSSIIHKKIEFVQHSGVDISLFQPEQKVRSSVIKFLFSGNLNKKKGVLIAIEAFKSIKREDVELHICGNGELADFARNASINCNRIIYHEYKQGEELASIYRMCDILVFPTTAREQHPLVVVEALASGLFVITSLNLYGIFDTFYNEKALVYCEPTTKGVNTAMLESMENIDIIRKNKQMFSNLVLDYDWKNVTLKLFDKFEEIYYQLKK